MLNHTRFCIAPSAGVTATLLLLLFRETQHPKLSRNLHSEEDAAGCSQVVRLVYLIHMSISVVTALPFVANISATCAYGSFKMPKLKQKKKSNIHVVYISFLCANLLCYNEMKTLYLHLKKENAALHLLMKTNESYLPFMLQ